ncbi:MAG: hypothetical protein WD623_10390 [Marinobacter sp.]|uniref:hypothetical protein n=1 Tax=Marinobacter sp. TaxID=50741 RepID=UPI0034A038D4
MKILDPRTPEEKETWKRRGATIVYRSGEVRALLWRMLRWCATAFSAAIAAGSIIYSFWLSATFALFLTVIFLSPVRRWLRFDSGCQLNGRLQILGLGILVIVVLAAICQLEVMSRINDFYQQREQIVTRAEKAVERSDYQAVYALAKRFDVVPGQPLEAIASKAQAKQKEEKERLEAFTEVFLDQYRRQRDSRREAEAGADSAGER